MVSSLFGRSAAPPTSIRADALVIGLSQNARHPNWHEINTCEFQDCTAAVAVLRLRFKRQAKSASGMEPSNLISLAFHFLAAGRLEGMPSARRRLHTKLVTRGRRLIARRVLSIQTISQGLSQFLRRIGFLQEVLAFNQRRAVARPGAVAARENDFQFRLLSLELTGQIKAAHPIRHRQIGQSRRQFGA